LAGLACAPGCFRNFGLGFFSGGMTTVLPENQVRA